MSQGSSARPYQHLSALLFIALCVLVFYIAYSAGDSNTLQFGDDTGALSNNGECSDIRFRGPGMGLISTETGSLTDAMDCQTLFNDGGIFLSSEQANTAIAAIEFGDDLGNWTNDGECDDPRFEGEDSAYSTDIDDIGHDATDCRTLIYRGQVSYTGEIEIQIVDGITFGDDFSSWANDGQCDDPRFDGQGMADALQESDSMHDATDCVALYSAGSITYVGDFMDRADIAESGELTLDDAMQEDGKFYDTYTFDGLAGQNVMIDLRSNDFDTYLYLISPEGTAFTNDDFEGDTSRSVLDQNLDLAGTYEIRVSSFSAGSTGSYDMAIVLGEVIEMDITLDENGTLEDGDELWGSGEYVDRFEFAALPGQSIRISLESDDFDTYIRLYTPGGEMLTDDDGFGGTNSLLELEAPEPGIYEVLATSYTAAASGQYRLQVAQSRAALPLNIGL